ncbi:MAG: sugar ABC transporter permease [Limnochordia bacterium]|jgi:multiple sugar transport system permease protein|nr:sugar ABC transporter permease [Limnochordia bacterium]
MLFKRIWKARSGYLFILPKYVFFTMFVLIPIVWSIFVSFQEYRVFGTEWVGLRNFQDVLYDDLFWTAVGNTLRYAVVVMPSSVLIALTLASLINPLKRGAQTFFRASFYLPTVASSVVIAMVWRWIFQTRFGLANYFLSLFGVDSVNWLHSSAWALKSVIIMAVLTPPGMGIILYLAAMASIPESLYEAATIDGANRFMQWWKITLPLLKPTTLYLMIVSTIGSFQVFDQVMLMTQGGPGYATTTIVHRIYNVAFRDFQFGYAGAMSMFLFVAIITLAIIQSKVLSSDVEYKG